jgi:ribosomal subunit interface protein
MDIQISGKRLDVGDALRAHVSDRLETNIVKYFDQSVDGHVYFAKEGNDFKCDANIHLSSGISLQAGGQASDAYGAFDMAAERLEKRLRRYKRRLKDHHNKHKEAMPATAVASYVIQTTETVDEAEEPGDLQPVIVAEDMTQIKVMSVGEAVMQMDLADTSVLLFKTSDEAALNVVYRRSDGNIGWIDPGNTK